MNSNILFSWKTLAFLCHVLYILVALILEGKIHLLEIVTARNNYVCNVGILNRFLLFSRVLLVVCWCASAPRRHTFGFFNFGGQNSFTSRLSYHPDYEMYANSVITCIIWALLLWVATSKSTCYSSRPAITVHRLFSDILQSYSLA
jgi:hypothetical protein